MLEEGRKLAKIAKNVAVKVPLTPDGLKTCKDAALGRHHGERHLCFSAARPCSPPRRSPASSRPSSAASTTTAMTACS
jgi:transaldolase